jgi:hypothetical protein
MNSAIPTLALTLGLLGAYDGPLNADQPPRSAQASPSTPSSLTDSQIDDILQRARLRLVGERVRYIWCGWLPRPSRSPGPISALPSTPTTPGAPNTGTTSGPTSPDEHIPAPAPQALSQTGYSTWAKYIADHIESGTAFGSDYPQIAAAALDPTGITDSSMSWCRGGATTFIPEQRAIATVDPGQVGRTLFDAISPYDQDTRRRAAHKMRP